MVFNDTQKQLLEPTKFAFPKISFQQLNKLTLSLIEVDKTKTLALTLDLFLIL